MRKSKLSLRIICREVRAILGTRFSEGWKKRRGRPREFCDVFIISLFLWQTLKGLSYREVLAEARREFGISPALSVYHYRLKKLIPKYFKELQEKLVEKFFRGKEEKLNSSLMELGLVSMKCIHLNSTGEEKREALNLM